MAHFTSNMVQYDVDQFNPQTICKEVEEAWNFWGILGGGGLMRNF